ncbi:ABC transporter substrate-binding protein [Motilibacter aurantiacus]|uniref:ABC transporter substrate-binding protein n=1 Tax=Motilibacter aurantiacus TaxID=2714955 RepID=UPI001407A9EF|nr:extracellular solute-binding protein [Motilibacter aurantiacus]NHC46284.1 extracellular solute-binding protein [Motilibacter aurantiacus]
MGVGEVLSRRAFLGRAAVGAFGLLTLPACGPGGPGHGVGPGALDVWVWQDAADKVQQAAVDRFNASGAGRARLNRVPGDGYEDKLRVAIGSSKAPDVFFNWGGASVKEYADAGELLDLTPMLQADTAFGKAFLPSVLQAGMVGDRYYGIPMRGTQPVLVFYNKAVFADAGVSPPETWDDVTALIAIFTEQGVTPFALAGADAWAELMWLEYLVDRFGGPGVFERVKNGDVRGWRDPAVLRAAKAVVDLIERGAFGHSFSAVGYNAGGASALLSRGRAAMQLMGSWEYANQLAADPEFARGRLGWTTFPTVTDGRGDPDAVVGNPNNFWSVTAGVRDPEAAFAFLRTAAEDAYAADLVGQGAVPTTTDAASFLDRSADPAFARFQYDLVQRASTFTVSWDQALPSAQATGMLTLIRKLFAAQLAPAELVEALTALPRG